ncbi:uncharacterized protein EV422DRAFT_131203 [Fimicolochytrium jonesii]|uniref:uncharacterized protein n=1 Tax=Fimicolochytrium jonesii TaxID=1396493 RepID=UPI0022FE0A04|nr:uncharacterized protein EV422DRAFT_131203 [Fimicolochytrium jonesii]KAI8819055.1 hypothetical protein EV422DRAFT_131203 [Fimicolochytrium jonesii]
MSAVRTCVEWGFGKIIQLWAFVDFAKNQNIWLQPVGRFYLLATLFTNIHTCIHGSLTTSTFNVEPPTVQMYLQST